MIRLRLTMIRQRKSPRTALPGGTGALETPKKKKEGKGPAQTAEKGKREKGC